MGFLKVKFFAQNINLILNFPQVYEIIKGLNGLINIYIYIYTDKTSNVPILTKFI